MSCKKASFNFVQKKWCVMEFLRYPEWSAAIRNFYWYLPFSRGFDLVKIRKQFRRIASEKNASKLKALILS